MGVRNHSKMANLKEMVPEIVVPDLEGFKLKPYVSYKSADVVQSAFTAEDLFEALYAVKIRQDFKNGKLDKDGNPIEPSEAEKLTSSEALMNSRKTGSDIF